MARGDCTAAPPAYLFEHYAPGSGVEQLTSADRRVRESIDVLSQQGRPIRVLRSTIVPNDESFLCVVEAGSEELVREAYVDAGIRLERISAAISVGANNIEKGAHA